MKTRGRIVCVFNLLQVDVNKIPRRVRLMSVTVLGNDLLKHLRPRLGSFFQVFPSGVIWKELGNLWIEEEERHFERRGKVHQFLLRA